MSFNLAVRAIGYNDADLAALAEHVECRAWTDIVAAAPPWLQQSTGLRAEEVGGSLALIAPTLNSLLFNRVIGLGEHAPATNELICGLMDRYWTLGIKHYWVHAGPYARPARLGRLLHEHGLETYRRSCSGGDALDSRGDARVSLGSGASARPFLRHGQRVRRARAMAKRLCLSHQHQARERRHADQSSVPPCSPSCR